MLQKQSSLVRSCSGFSLPLYKTVNVTVCGGLVLGWFYSLLLWDNLVQGQVFGKGNAVSCEALSDVLICDLIGIVVSIRKYFHHLMVDQQKNAPLSGSLLSYCKKKLLVSLKKMKKHSAAGDCVYLLRSWRVWQSRLDSLVNSRKQ